MDPITMGALIGGGSALIGGAMNSNSSAAAMRAQERIAADNIALQKQFAKQGIRWRVEDAKAAGVHPLAALGANVSSFSPISIGTDFSSPVGDSISRAGQDISRAVSATMTKDERVKKNLLDTYTLERAKLENDLLRSQIIKVNQPSSPGLPSNSSMPLLTGQGDSTPTFNSSGYVNENPLDRTHSQPGNPAQEVGSVSDYGYVRTAGGGLAIVPSKDAKDRIEDQMIPELSWAFRNNVMPFFVDGYLPEPDPKYYPLPSGYSRWKYQPFIGEFRPSN